MEVKFEQNTLQCLKKVFSKLHTQEQTLEIRLPDAYPDIGKILGCWGQTLIRSKEWNSTSIAANEGVMAWLLYAPEDGTQPRIVDAWIPIQCRWELPEGEDDGVIHLRSVLSSLDGRGVSARKIMLRACVDTFVEAVARHSVVISQPPQLPEDVQLLTRSYPVELPVEAGEKQLQLQERFSLPGSQIPIRKILHYSLSPVITEQKVLGNRMVFRGQCPLQMSYIGEDEEIHTWQTEIPFSQYTELDRDYSSNATAQVIPAVTAMELEMVEDQLHLQSGIAAQYTIFDRNMLELVEDAYSPTRPVSIERKELDLPVLLDSVAVNLPAESIIPTDAGKALCLTAMAQYPTLIRDEEGVQIRVEGQFQALTRGEDDVVAGESARFESSIPFATASENDIMLWPGFGLQPEATIAAEGLRVQGSCPVTVQVYSGKTIPMICQLQLGELKTLDEERPSLLLRRVGEGGLWNLAKESGSTVASIQEANQLSSEPEVGRLLLIPVS